MTIEHARWVMGCALSASLLGLASGAADAAVRIEGQVQIGGGAVAGSTVSLWAASADAPARLAQVQTDADGRFAVSVDATPSGASSLYLVASGGAPAVNKAGGDNKEIDLLAVLGSDPPPKVVVNELTTVASAFTNARFLKGESISGNPLGLKIAAGNAPNLVDPATGGWGKALLDPLNSTQNTTLANLDTLGSLITAFAAGSNEDWRARFLKAATPSGRRRAQEHAGGDGGYRARIVGRPEGPLRAVRRGLPAAEGRLPPRGARSRPICSGRQTTSP